MLTDARFSSDRRNPDNARVAVEDVRIGGFGVHQCLGQDLARMELQIVFDTLFRRIPTLRLAAPADTLPYKDDALIYGIHEVPVTWD